LRRVGGMIGDVVAGFDHGFHDAGNDPRV
jgi:hypothetical protein